MERQLNTVTELYPIQTTTDHISSCYGRLQGSVLQNETDILLTKPRISSVMLATAHYTETLPSN